MFSTKRMLKTFVPGDEITAKIVDIAINGNNLGLTLTPIDNGKEMSFKLFHTFGAYETKGRYFFEQFLNCMNVPEDVTSERWFINRTVKFICKENTWDGKTFLAVDRWLPITDKDSVSQTIVDIKNSVSLPIASKPEVVDENFFLVGLEENKPKKVLRKVVVKETSDN